LILNGGINMAIEEPSYTIREQEGNIEIRDYPALIAAEVNISGDRFTAVKSGFRLLAAYIFGGNQRNQKIDMTAPVIQTQTTEEMIPMTAPVTQTTASGEDQWIIRFMMPKSYSLDTLPTPNDQRVKLIVLPTTRFAVIRFSGLANELDIEKKTSELIAFITLSNLISSGTPTLARYNPPWTLWFMRRNEIMIPLLVEAGQNSLPISLQATLLKACEFPSNVN
jgi:hypothetical protein